MTWIKPNPQYFVNKQSYCLNFVQCFIVILLGVITSQIGLLVMGSGNLVLEDSWLKFMVLVFECIIKGTLYTQEGYGTICAAVNQL